MKTFNSYLTQANHNILLYKCSEFENDFLSALLAGELPKEAIVGIINLRTEAFKLQSFGRVLRRCGESPYELIGNSIRDESKFCEDAIGRFLYSYEMYCEVINIKSDLKEDAISELLVAYFEFLDVFNIILEKQKSITGLLAKLPGDHLAIRKLYLSGLKKELKKISKNINEINPEELEDGTHKLRRLIRWVIMHIIYPEGLFAFKAVPGIGPSKFLKLKPKAINRPVQLSYSSLRELSAMVAILGKSKDKLLYHHYEDGLKNKSFDINKSDFDTINLTQEILNKLKSEKWIKKVRKEL